MRKRQKMKRMLWAPPCTAGRIQTGKCTYLRWKQVIESNNYVCCTLKELARSPSGNMHNQWARHREIACGFARSRSGSELDTDRCFTSELHAVVGSLQGIAHSKNRCIVYSSPSSIGNGAFAAIMERRSVFVSSTPFGHETCSRVPTVAECAPSRASTAAHSGYCRCYCSCDRVIGVCFRFRENMASQC